MTAMRIFFTSLIALVMALVLANVSLAPYHHLAGAAILPLFVIMLVSLNIAKRSLSRDRTSTADYGRNSRDPANIGYMTDTGGTDAG